MSDEQSITVEKNDDAVIVTFRGERIEYDASGKLRSETVAAAGEHPGLPVIVDISGVQLIPSVSIGALITLAQVLNHQIHQIRKIWIR